jgi:hypothetical protein
LACPGSRLLDELMTDRAAPQTTVDRPSWKRGLLEHVENPDALRKQIAERVFVREERDSEESRFTSGHRGMSLAELSELVRVICTPHSRPAPGGDAEPPITRWNFALTAGVASV